MSPRPQMDHIRKPQILAAAAEVISERGLGATRVADVAERAGTSPAAVIYWFGDREQLLNAALGWAEDAFYDSLSEALERLDDPGRRLALLFDASADDYDWTLWMELWIRALRDDEARETRQRLDDRWRKVIADQVRAGQAGGGFATTYEPEEVALVLASLLDGLAVQATLGDAEISRDRMQRLTLESAERMLGIDLTTPDQRTATATT